MILCQQCGKRILAAMASESGLCPECSYQQGQPVEPNGPIPENVAPSFSSVYKHKASVALGMDTRNLSAQEIALLIQVQLAKSSKQIYSLLLVMLVLVPVVSVICGMLF